MLDFKLLTSLATSFTSGNVFHFRRVTSQVRFLQRPTSIAHKDKQSLREHGAIRISPEAVSFGSGGRI